MTLKEARKLEVGDVVSFKGREYPVDDLHKKDHVVSCLLPGVSWVTQDQIEWVRHGTHPGPEPELPVGEQGDGKDQPPAGTGAVTSELTLGRLRGRTQAPAEKPPEEV